MSQYETEQPTEVGTLPEMRPVNPVKKQEGGYSKFPNSLSALFGESSNQPEIPSIDTNTSKALKRIEKAKLLIDIIKADSKLKQSTKIELSSLSERIVREKNPIQRNLLLNEASEKFGRLGTKGLDVLKKLEQADDRKWVATSVGRNDPVLSSIIDIQGNESLQHARYTLGVIEEMIGKQKYTDAQKRAGIDPSEMARQVAIARLVLDAHIEEQMANTPEGQKLTRASEIVNRNIKAGKLKSEDGASTLKRLFPHLDTKSTIPNALLKAEKPEVKTAAPVIKSKEVLKGVSSKESLKKAETGKEGEKKGTIETIKNEARVILEALKRTEADTKAMGKLGFQRAYQELILRGNYDEKYIRGILSQYVEGEVDQGKNRPYFEAFMKTIERKRQESAYLHSLSDEADLAFKGKAEERPDFEAKFIAKKLVRRLANGQGQTEQQISELEAAVENGKIVFLTPTIAFSESNSVGAGGSANGIEFSPTFPVMVANKEYMAKITGAEAGKAPRGMFYQVRDTAEAKNEIHRRDVDIVLVESNSFNDDPKESVHNGTFSHELSHLIWQSSRAMMAEQYATQAKEDLYPLFISKFKKEAGGKIILGAQDEDTLRKTFADLIDGKDIKAESAAAKEFVKFLSKGGGGYGHFKTSLEIVQNARDEFDNPLDEIVTKGMDMQGHIGLREIGAIREDKGSEMKTYNKNDPKMRGSLGLVRMYNAMYGANESAPSQEYEDHKSYLWKKVNREFGFEPHAYPIKVAKMVKGMLQESKAAGPDIEHAKAVMKVLGLTPADSGSFIDTLPTLFEEGLGENLKNLKGKNFENITSSDLGAFFKGLDERIKPFENDPSKRKEVDILMDLRTLKDDPQAFLIYCRLMLNDPTTLEIEGRGTYGVYGVNKDAVRGKASVGFNSQARNFFNFNPIYKDYGAENTPYTNLEMVPLVGPVAQTLLDTFNPKSRVYTHYKDPGPFGGIPFLNLKIWRDNFGTFLDDPLHRMDTSNPMEGWTQLLGINIFRNPGFLERRNKSQFEGEDSVKIRQQKENRRAVLANERPKDVGKWGYNYRFAYLPEAILQPSWKAYYDLALSMLNGLVLPGAGIAPSDSKTILSVIGGYSSTTHELKSADFNEIDEYRANKKMVTFLDKIAHRFNKSPEWVKKQREYMENDGYLYLDKDTGPNGKDWKDIDIPIMLDDVDPINVDELTEGLGAGRKNWVKKGTITKNLLKDITETIVCKVDDKAEGLDTPVKKNIEESIKKKKAFEIVGRAMMTADRYRKDNNKGEYTVYDLLNQLVQSDSDPRLFKPRDKYNKKTGKWEGYNQEVQLFLDNPTIDIVIGDNDQGEGKKTITIATKDAKEFIAQYFIARLRRVTELGVWGMKDEKGLTVASRPELDDRKYDMETRRKIANIDEDVSRPTMQYELTDPVSPFSDELMNTVNGEFKHDYKGEDGKTYTFIKWMIEDMAHDGIWGAIDGAEKGRWRSWLFTVKMRQSEQLRDMAKSKKDLWEGTNNIDDQFRSLVLIYTLACIFFPALNFLMVPGIPLATIGWSVLVSPFINRNAKGWSKREMGAIEAIAALRDQHDFFFKLADDRQYHSKNDIGTASSLYETIKYTYKKALVPLTEHGRPDSNFISKKAHELLSKL